jgi:hypothetical protein
MGIRQQLEANKTKMSLLGGAPTLGSPAGETIGHGSFYKPNRCHERGKCHTTGRQRAICRQSLRNSKGSGNSRKPSGTAPAGYCPPLFPRGYYAEDWLASPYTRATLPVGRS